MVNLMIMDLGVAVAGADRMLKLAIGSGFTLIGTFGKSKNEDRFFLKYPTKKTTFPPFIFKVKMFF